MMRARMTSTEPRPAEVVGALLGNYRVLQLLGEGGMGEVYVGRHERLGHRVAVKVLRLEMSRNADMVRRFFNEAQAATAIRSAGIVQIFDFGTLPDGRAYFVMELLEGQSLDARLKQRRLDYVACCRLGRQVANVLHAAHTAGITHRDLKPENLFLIQDVEVAGGERVKVLDFGIAKLADEIHASGVKTRTNVVMGTPSYMSPEQSRGASAVDARSDIYSLGCILFEMVCGRPPFVGEGLGGIIGAHQYVDPPQPRSLAPDVPTRLAKLILQMLEKKPDARPQTMAAVGQALEEILQTLDKTPKRASRESLAPKRASTASPAPPSVPAPTMVVPNPLAFGAPGEKTVIAGPHAGSRRRMWSTLGGLVTAVIVIGIVAGALSSGSSKSAESVAAGSVAADAGAADAGAADSGVADSLAADSGAAGSGQEANTASGALEIIEIEEPTVSEKKPTPPVAIAEESRPRPPPVEAVRSPSGAGKEIVVECLRYQSSEKWADLDACADRLKAVNPAIAKELKTRAALEIKAVPRVQAFDAAMRNKDLKKAQAELEGLTAITNYEKLKQTYQKAENAAIQDLAKQLERAKDCKEYEQIVEHEKASKPPRVAAEAAGQVKCIQVAATPPANCNHEELVEKGRDQFGSGQLTAALANLEAAYDCKPDPTYAEKAFIVACNIRNLEKAKLFWKRMYPLMQQRARSICERNGITEDMLNAP